jgi:hypothetical protein
MSSAERPAHQHLVALGDLVFDGDAHVGVDGAQVSCALPQHIGVAESLSRDVPDHVRRNDLVDHGDVVLRPELLKVAARDGFVLFS